MLTSFSTLADDVEDAFPTVYANYAATYETHKSTIVESNEVGIGSAYTLGVHAGKNRTLGIRYQVSSSAIGFELNDTQITQSWTETSIYYRFGGFYLGGVIGQAAMTVTENQATSVDLVGDGFGGTFGFVVPVRKGFWYFDATYVQISTVREVTQQTVSIGPKMAIQFGKNFDLSRSFTGTFGLVYRTIASDIGLGGTDTISGILLGLGSKSFF